jgi:PAS domain S-box-containing protein
MQLVTALALLGLLLAVVDGVLAGRSLRHERHARRAEQRTREDKQFLDTMLDSLRAGIIASNGDGQLTLLNRATREFHGLPAASIPLSEWDQYCTVYEADGATPLPEERIPIVRALRGEHVDDQEIVVAPRTGAARTLLASGRVIVDAEGEQLGAVVAMLDITSRRTAERELAAKAAELERSNAELERFAYVASHDLQEPLRMVSSYTQLLARRYTGRLDDNADEFIRYAVNGATRMQRLINDLLVYSRVSSRARQATPTDSGRAVATALSNLSRAIEDTGAEVDVGPLPEVLVDGSQLVQVFQNLIGNAIKFHSPGNRPIIRIGALRQNGMWQISVHDNGLGIDPAYFDRIFILFQRLHTRDTYSGTGIGLAICKKIVERHGGRIWVDSAEGRGATFTFTLPGATDGQDESATAHDH